MEGTNLPTQMSHGPPSAQVWGPGPSGRVGKWLCTYRSDPCPSFVAFRPRGLVRDVSVAEWSCPALLFHPSHDRAFPARQESGGCVRVAPRVSSASGAHHSSRSPVHSDLRRHHVAPESGRIVAGRPVVLYEGLMGLPRGVEGSPDRTRPLGPTRPPVPI